MKKGEIVLIPFPFTELTQAKLRPAIVLIENEYDITVSFITSQQKKQESTDVVIYPSKLNGLKKNSLIRLSKIATIDKSLIIGKLGEINLEETLLINERLKILFQID